MLRIVASATLLLGACTIAFRSPPKAQCIINADCNGTSVCFYGVCKPAPALALSDTWAEMTQSRGTPFIQQRSLEKTGRSDLAIAQPRTWSGVIVDTTGNRQDGYVLLQRVSLIPSRQLSFEAPTLGTRKFSVPLEAGVYHPIFFDGNADIYPPLLLADWKVDTADNNLSLNYPDLSSLTHIRGRIGPSAANQTLGVSARVYVVQSSTQLSSTATQTDGNGKFELLMAPSVVSTIPTPLSLVIGPSDVNAFVPLRTIDLTGSGVVITSQTQLPDYYLDGIANTASVSGTIVGADASGASTPLPGATILATTTIGGGTFTTGALSDASGTFKLALLTSTNPDPLSYTVSIVPAPSSEFGRTEVRYDLLPTGEPAPLSIKLGARLTLSGTVLDADGKAVSNAQVVASPEDAAVVGASSLQALTGADGRFALRVDPNTYGLSIVPQPGSALPNGSGSAEVTTSNVDTTLTLPRGVFLCGEVTAPTSTAVPITVAGTSVRFYRDAGDAEGAMLIGVSVVDANSHYSVVLPSQ